MPADLSILMTGSEAWSKWREANPTVTPNLSGADLRGSDLAGWDLHSVNFTGCNLTGVSLRGAALQNGDLSETTGLHVAQLAGADLAGAKLPPSVGEVLKDLTSTKGITDNAQKLFVAMLAACLYSWLTIATTTDLNLITNRASSPLPIIQTSIPIVGFYVVAPLLLAGVYFYFHLYLQKLWDDLGSLPAIFPDGRPLQAKADPWLLSDLVQSHVSKLSAGRPFLSWLQKWISILLAWWVVPITLLLFWARYLPRHDWRGTIFHSAIAAICITAAVFLYRLASDTLSGKERQQFSWRTALVSVGAYRTIAVAVGVMAALVVASAGTLNGIRGGTSDLDWWPIASGPASWLPRVMTAAGYSPFADLRTAEISVKPATWTGSGSDVEYNSVKGLQLASADLRYADLRNAFLPLTVLTGAHLEWTDLLLADLRRSELVGAHLYKADLLGARLNGADMVGIDLRNAELTGADLTDADLRYADLTGTTGVTKDQIAKAKNWQQAIYDASLLQNLGLPSNNNDVVRKQRASDEDSMRPGPRGGGDRSRVAIVALGSWSRNGSKHIYRSILDPKARRCSARRWESRTNRDAFRRH